MGIPLLHSVSASVCFIFCILALLCPIQCATPVRPEERIVGGENATEDEFPYQVYAPTRIKNTNSFRICGGSILNADYILLAGHCVANATPREIRDMNFVVGKIDINDLQPIDHHPVEVVIVHPCYNQKDTDHEYLLNDIAIVKLVNPLPLNGKNIDKIQIDEKNLATDGTVTRAIGWGRTQVSSAQVLSHVLKKASLEVMTSQCKGLLGLDQFEPDGQICASSDKAFLCEGDTGSPLLCDDGTGEPVVCGVASSSYNLDPKKTRCRGPSVFTRVYHYRDWIKSVLSGKRNTSEGCINGKGPKPKPKPEPGTEDKNQQTSHGFPSYRPSRLTCGICLILSFLSFWGR